MEEEQQRADGDGCKKVENGSGETENTLESFVTGHYQRQKDAGKMEATEEIDEERTSKFFSRALTESRRMNEEVNKSNKKLDAMRAEFGVEMVNAWQDEHASQVLQPHQQELVKQAQYQGT